MKLVPKIKKLYGRTPNAIMRRCIFCLREKLGYKPFVPKHTISKKYNNKRLLVAVTYGLGDTVLAATIVPYLREKKKSIKYIDILIPEYHQSLTPLLEKVFDKVIVIPKREYVGRIPLSYELLQITNKLEWQERYLSHYSNEPNHEECKNFFEVICSRYDLPRDIKPTSFDIPKEWKGIKKNQIMLNLSANSINYNDNWWLLLLQEVDELIGKDIKFVINGDKLKSLNISPNTKREIEFFNGSFGELVKESLASLLVVSTRSGLNDVLGVLGYDNQIIFYPENDYPGNDEHSDYYKLSKMGFHLPNLREYDIDKVKLREVFSVLL